MVMRHTTIAAWGGENREQRSAVCSTAAPEARCDAVPPLSLSAGVDGLREARCEC